MLIETLLISATIVFLSHPDPLCLLQLKGGLGMNIVSAIVSVVGICLFIADICISQQYLYHSWEGVSIPLDQRSPGSISAVFRRSLERH